MTLPSSAISIEILADVEAVARIEGDWNNLLKISHTQTVELSSIWQLTHWAHFHDDASLYVLVAREGGVVVGIAPLKIVRLHKYGTTLRSLEWIAAVESNYQDFIYPAGRADIVNRLLNYLAEHRADWDIFTLRNLPDSSLTTAILSNEGDFPFASRTPSVETCLYVTLDKPWSEHLTHLPKKRRDDIAYRTRRLQKRGQVTYRRCDDEKQFITNFRNFFTVHQKRWNPTATPSMFNDPRFQAFYLESARALFAAGMAELHILELDNVPIAFLYILVFDCDYMIQLITYDPDYADCSPSVVLHEHFVRALFDEFRARMIDFGQHYEYKELWANATKKHLTIKLYSPTPRGQYAFLRDRWHRFAHDHSRRLTPARLSGYARRKLARISR